MKPRESEIHTENDIVNCDVIQLNKQNIDMHTDSINRQFDVTVIKFKNARNSSKQLRNCRKNLMNAYELSVQIYSLLTSKMIHETNFNFVIFMK